MSQVQDDFEQVEALAAKELFVAGVELLPLTEHAAALATLVGSHSESYLKTAIGPLGARLAKFIVGVDLTHPDLNLAFADADSNNLIAETIKLYKMAKEAGLQAVAPDVRHIITKNVAAKLDNLDFLRQRGYRCHILADRKDRDEVRRTTKTMKGIELAKWYERPNWATEYPNLPNSMRILVRNNNDHEPIIKAAKVKGERYAELGCTSLHNEIDRGVQRMEEKVSKRFVGLVRVTMVETAVMLAKLHGYEIGAISGAPASRIRVGRTTIGFDPDGPVPDKKADDLCLLFDSPTGKAYVSMFDTSRQYTFHPQSMAEVASSDPRASASSDSRPDHWEYVPKAYSMNGFTDIASARTLSFIDRLESMPEAGDRAVFDHFVVVVPTIDLGFATGSDVSFSGGYGHSFYNKAGERKTYGSVEEARREFDRELVRSKVVTAVLLGERDGVCYFISYFEAA